MDQHPQEQAEQQHSTTPTTPAPQQSKQSAPQSTPQPSPSSNDGGLAPNVAAALSYVLGWLTGIVFFLISKDKFVKFHAMQSIITSLAAMVIHYVLFSVLRLWSIVGLFNLAVFALFIFLIVQAYQQKMYKLPVIGDLAEQWAGGEKQPKSQIGDPEQ